MYTTLLEQGTENSAQGSHDRASLKNHHLLSVIERRVDSRTMQSSWTRSSLFVEYVGSIFVEIDIA